MCYALHSCKRSATSNENPHFPLFSIQIRPNSGKRRPCFPSKSLEKGKTFSTFGITPATSLELTAQKRKSCPNFDKVASILKNSDGRQPPHGCHKNHAISNLLGITLGIDSRCDYPNPNASLNVRGLFR